MRSLFIPAKQYSDFFIYSSQCEENLFIAENTYALMKGNPIKVKHSFKFYSNTGKIFKTLDVSTNEFFSTIKLPKLKSDFIYSSFTHHVFPEKKDSEMKNTILNHRGYMIFKKKVDSIGSVLHGNLGGMECRSYSSAARKRNAFFRFTPVYKFEKENKYHLVFNNPTNRKIKITIQKYCQNGNYEVTNNEDHKIIPKFGCDFYELSNYTGRISFISQLPVCRAFVIKNPDIKSSNFDVFHS